MAGVAVVGRRHPLESGAVLTEGKLERLHRSADVGRSDIDDLDLPGRSERSDRQLIAPAIAPADRFGLRQQRAAELVDGEPRPLARVAERDEDLEFPVAVEVAE